MIAGRTSSAPRRSGAVRRTWDDVRAVTAARLYLRRAEHLGQRVRVRGRPSVTVHGRLVVHDRVQLVSTVAQLELVVEWGASLEIGERSLVNFGSSIVAYEKVTIGRHALIGTHCLILDTPFHELDPARRLQRPPPQPITIGENVWIGARVIVMPGVTIGDDCAIGAGSIVTHDIPPRTLALGSPARVVREL